MRTEQVVLPEPGRTLLRRTYPILVRRFGGASAKAGFIVVGGGTMLAARWGHRASKDLDIKVNNSEGGVAPVQWTPSDCAEEVFAMAKTHPPYAPEFRRQMVELVRSGRSAGDPTFADAILDRLVHNAYKLKLKGDSMRKTKTPLTQADH